MICAKYALDVDNVQMLLSTWSVWFVIDMKYTSVLDKVQMPYFAMSHLILFWQLARELSHPHERVRRSFNLPGFTYNFNHLFCFEEIKALTDFNQNAYQPNSGCVSWGTNQNKCWFLCAWDGQRVKFWKTFWSTWRSRSPGDKLTDYTKQILCRFAQLVWTCS